MAITTLTDTGNSTTNRTNLQAACIDGATVFIDAATYTIDRNGSNTYMISLAGVDNLTLYGRGRGATIIKWDTGEYPIDLTDDIYMFSCIATTINVTVRDLGFDGSYSEIQAAGQWPAGGEQFHVWSILDSERMTFERCDFFNYRGDAIRLVNSPSEIAIDKCRFWEGYRSGISIRGGSQIFITDNVFLPYIADQAIDAEATGNKTHLVIRGNYLENGSAAHVFAPVLPGGPIWIDNNTFIGKCQMTSCNQVWFTNNRVYSPGIVFIIGFTTLRMSGNHMWIGGEDSEEGALYSYGNNGLIDLCDNWIYHDGVGAAVHLAECNELNICNNRIYWNDTGKGPTGIRLYWTINPSIVLHAKIKDNRLYDYSTGIWLRNNVGYTGKIAELRVEDNDLIALETPTGTVYDNSFNKTITREITGGNYATDGF